MKFGINGPDPVEYLEISSSDSDADLDSDSESELEVEPNSIEGQEQEQSIEVQDQIDSIDSDGSHSVANINVSAAGLADGESTIIIEQQILDSDNVSHTDSESSTISENVRNLPFIFS